MCGAYQEGQESLHFWFVSFYPFNYFIEEGMGFWGFGVLGFWG